jgi:N-acetylmuramoyl-L-alanine amidase
VLHWHASTKGAFLADSIEMALATQFPSRPARGPKPRDELTVLSQTSMPAVIVECGFITNSYEEGWLASFVEQAAIAWAICQGIERAYPEPNGGASI